MGSPLNPFESPEVLPGGGVLVLILGASTVGLPLRSLSWGKYTFRVPRCRV